MTAKERIIKHDGREYLVEWKSFVGDVVSICSVINAAGQLMPMEFHREIIPSLMSQLYGNPNIQKSA